MIGKTCGLARSKNDMVAILSSFVTVYDSGIISGTTGVFFSVEVMLFLRFLVLPNLPLLMELSGITRLSWVE